jgi:hypothetical protein
MRSILEKAFYSLLNQEKDKADALVHEFMIERARQIHESLRQGEDFVLDESWEQELSIDEMFSEADLVDDEENVDGEDAPVGDDAAGDDVDAEADADGEELEVDGDVDAEVDGDAVEGEEIPLEDRVSELEAELQRLAAVFDDEMGAGEVAVGDEVSDDDMNLDGDEEDEVVEGDLEITQSDDGALSMSHDVDGLGDDDFESLGESALSELEKVAAPANTEGKYLQDGKATVNTKSPTLSKPVEQRQAGEPVKIKSSTHSGYERESAPKSTDMKARQNTMKKADAKQSSVSKEGDKSALINDGKEDKSAQHSLFDKKHK